MKWNNINYLTLPQQVEKNRKDILDIARDPGVSGVEIVDARQGEETLGANITKVKSQLAEMSAQIESVDEKADNPLEQIADLSIPSSKFKILNENDRLGLENLKQEVIQAMAGTTPVNSIPADYSVTLQRTSFSMAGKNLFNKDTASIGYFVSESDGILYENISYNTSDFIKVIPNGTYTRSGFDGRIAYYDIDKVFISGTQSGGLTQTTPSNCYYVRYSFYTPLETMQFEKGFVATSYEPFLQYIDLESIVKNKSISNRMIGDKVVDIAKTDFISTGKNIFDKSKITNDYFVNNLDGTLNVNPTYASSDYIPIEGNTTYTQSVSRYSAFYDTDKKYISGLDAVGNEPRTFTTPTNAKYMRLTCAKGLEVDTCQLEEGGFATEYEPYGIKLVNSSFTKDEFKVFLPSEICVAVGRTIELYNNQVSWCGNINNYHFKWDCAIGKAMKRKFTVTGTTPLIGEYPLVLKVYDNNMNLITTRNTTIKIISATISGTKNIVTIGDSLTNNKPWLQELRTLSTDKYTMIGTKGVPNLQHEGRSGFSAMNYLAATADGFEELGVHPFWDGTRFNWNYYKTQTGLLPNAVQLFLGTNNMALDPTQNANDIKQLVDYIRQDDATIPIFIVHTLYRGNQNGIGNEVAEDGYAMSQGNWELEENAKVFNLMVKVNELLKNYTNLHFVPIALCHDSEFNFGTVSTPVNPRSAQTELLPSQATHPQDQGYFQFADIMFSVMAKYLNS